MAVASSAEQSHKAELVQEQFKVHNDFKVLACSGVCHRGHFAIYRT